MSNLNCILAGVGYWGQNLARNITKIPNLNFYGIVESDKFARERAAYHYKECRIFTSLADALASKDKIDIVFIATPISTHYELAKTCLRKGCHVFVEKPLCTTTEQAKTLVELSDIHNKILFVGHTFIFSAAIKKLESLVTTNELGKLQLFHAVWDNLGIFQRDADVLLDLGPHPFSILKLIKEDRASFVSAVGTSHSKTNYINSVNISVGYKDNFQAYLQLSWISPKKTRQIVISGDKNMVLYDDTNTDEKLKIYDSGFDEDEQSRFSYRKGSIIIPKLSDTEPIYNEIDYFVRCVELQKMTYYSDARFGMEVVELIEAAQTSVSKNGAPVYL